VSKDNIIKLIQARKRRRSTHRNLAQWGACSVGPGDRGRGVATFLGKHADLKTADGTSALCATESPAGARGG